jgi:amino acid transporter/nucleotide-binding universal stress UspA family protein
MLPMVAIETKERLGRSLGFFSTFAIGTGTMIGAGIFILPGIAFTNAGAGAIFSFLIGGIISIATAISMAELATGMPMAGGSYYYISRTMGAAFGAIIGLGSWLGLVFKGTFALIGLAEYFQVFYPSSIYFVAAVSGLLLLVINYRGSKSSGSLQNIIIILLLVILTIFLAKVFFFVELANFNSIMPYGPVSVLTTTGTIFISYLGLAELAAISEEVKNPSKNLPRAFIASAVVVTIFYVLIMMAVVGVSSLHGGATTITPLADIADLIYGESGRFLIVFAALLATLSTANGAILSSSRFPFAMSRDALMPQWFVEIHKKYETPYNSILVTGVIMVLLLFLLDIEQLARLGGTFNILIYVLLNLAVIVLRKRTLPEYEPTFRDPFFPFTQIIGIVGSLILLPLLGGLPLLFAISLIALGAWWHWFYGRGKATPHYTLFDLLENNIEPVVIKSESVVKVLVPISNVKREHDLLKLADCLGDEIVGLHVIKVPDQTTLTFAQEAFHNKKIEIDSHFKEEFEQYPVILRHKRKYITAFDHSVSNSIIEQAEVENVDLVIMGWHESNRFQYSLGDVANEVLSSLKHHIVLLKGYLVNKITKILVAYNGKDNSVYGLHLAKKLAINTGAKIEIITIVSPDEDKDRKTEISENLRAISKSEEMISISFKMLERYSVEDAILEASNNADLTVIGDSSQRFKVSFLGTLPQRVARHSRNPVLIVKRSKPISKQNITYLLKKNANILRKKLNKSFK